MSNQFRSTFITIFVYPPLRKIGIKLESSDAGEDKKGLRTSRRFTCTTEALVGESDFSRSNSVSSKKISVQSGPFARSASKKCANGGASTSSCMNQTMSPNLSEIYHTFDNCTSSGSSVLKVPYEPLTVTINVPETAKEENK